MIMAPRVGETSARSASRTTAWYQSGKVDVVPVMRLTLSARCIGGLLQGDLPYGGPGPGAKPACTVGGGCYR